VPEAAGQDKRADRRSNFGKSREITFGILVHAIPDMGCFTYPSLLSRRWLVSRAARAQILNQALLTRRSVEALQKIVGGELDRLVAPF
jgi:hypothetical protein